MGICIARSPYWLHCGTLIAEYALLPCCLCLGKPSDGLCAEFCCNGNVVEDVELGKVIQLQGDQRKNVSTFLVSTILPRRISSRSTASKPRWSVVGLMLLRLGCTLTPVATLFLWC